MSFNDKAKELGFVSPKGFMAFDSVGDAVKLNKEKTALMSMPNMVKMIK